MPTTAPSAEARAPCQLTFNMQVAVSKFSGSAKENPETFIRTVESAKGLYSWSDAQAMAFAGLHLKGKALDWYNIQEPMTWLRFKKVLIGRFGLEPSRMLAALTKRVQGEKESVRDYADALCTLVRHSQDPNLQSTLRHFFMSGLREDVQSFVKTRRPETFEAAVAEGEYFEDTFLGGVAAAVSGHPSAWGKEAPATPILPTATPAKVLRNSTNDPVDSITRKLEKLSLLVHDLRLYLAADSQPDDRPANTWEATARPSVARAYLAEDADE